MSDQLPDRLSTNPNSPHYNEEILKRNVGVRFNGAEKTNIEEYCIFALIGLPDLGTNHG